LHLQGTPQKKAASIPLPPTHQIRISTYTNATCLLTIVPRTAPPCGSSPCRRHSKHRSIQYSTFPTSDPRISSKLFPCDDPHPHPPFPKKTCLFVPPIFRTTKLPLPLSETNSCISCRPIYCMAPSLVTRISPVFLSSSGISKLPVLQGQTLSFIHPPLDPPLVSVPSRHLTSTTFDLNLPTDTLNKNPPAFHSEVTGLSFGN
jgi:hypothetical protein